jgi:hypothetical protein
MADIAARTPPASVSALRRVIARHPVAAFLTMVFAVNVAVALSPVLNRRDLLPFAQAPYDWLAHILGSAVPAFVVTAAVRGRDGVRDLAGRCLRWRVGLRWYLIVLLGLPVALLLYATALYGTAPLEALVIRQTREWTAPPVPEGCGRTPDGGTLAIVYIEATDPDAHQRFTSSDADISRWFVQQMQELHGRDVSQPPLPVELVHDFRV